MSSSLSLHFEIGKIHFPLTTTPIVNLSHLLNNESSKLERVSWLSYKAPPYYFAPESPREGTLTACRGPLTDPFFKILTSQSVFMVQEKPMEEG